MFSPQRKFDDTEPLTDGGFGGSPDGGQPSLKPRTVGTSSAQVEQQTLVNPRHIKLPVEEDRTFASPRPTGEPERASVPSPILAFKKSASSQRAFAESPVPNRTSKE